MNTEELKSIYHDILNGYSFYSDNQVEFYVKHFRLEDLDLASKRRVQIENKAKNLGLLDEKTQIKNLIAKDGWSNDKENEIIVYQKYIKDLKYTKSRLIKTKDIERLAEQIKENEDKLNTILKEKQELLGTTLESYSNKKINEYYIYISLYKDPYLRERFLTKEQFEELEYEELYSLYFKYNYILNNINEKNIKKIALSPFFLNSFYLSNDDPYIFYGKPIVQLTFSQIELFSCGKFFKSIFTNSNTKPPENLMDDPDGLMEWYEGNKNANKTLNKNNKQESLGTSLVGASKKDMEKIGLKEENSIDLVKEANKKGGSLSFQDLIKLHDA